MTPQWKRGLYGTEENANTEEDHDCYAAVCSDALLSDESIMSSNAPTKTFIQKRTDFSGITKQSKQAQFPVPLNDCTVNFTCKVVGRDCSQTKLSCLTGQISGSRKNPEH